MTGADELGRTLAAIARSFEVLGVRWAVGGSIASAAYGEPRATNDVDVIATLSVEHARALVEHLHGTFYADQAAAEEAVRRRTSFNLIDQVTFIKVDVFVPAPRPGLGGMGTDGSLPGCDGGRGGPGGLGGHGGGGAGGSSIALAWTGTEPTHTDGILTAAATPATGGADGFPTGWVR